jgi:ABC-2 type transport system ATP-binding protein
MSGSIAIQTENLSRTYETYKKPEGLLNSVKGFWSREYISRVALKPTNLTVEKGQIVGLVGANGAGKTTLLKLLSGLIHPTSGTAHILGHVPWLREHQYLSRISLLLGQKNQLWWDLPASDSYELLAEIYNVPSTEAKKRVQELASLLQCREQLDIQLRRLSLGERMKMELIGALLHKPEVMFLDEPTIGLDVVAQTTIRNFLADYVATEGPTLILTSHYMDDIAKLADRLLLIRQGEIVYDGTVQHFTSKAEPRQKVSARLDRPTSQALALSSSLSVPTDTRQLEFEIPSSEVPTALRLIMSDYVIEELRIEEANFEDVIREFLEEKPGLRAPGHQANA